MQVSKNKRRYEENGFSLDLSYMTPQLIAMGVPSDGVEGKFRNHVSDVYRFFETRHPGGFRAPNPKP
jgi:phosphatidylinositol-3,4,5-trisphosphate 3-phosphatase/dual-specificity protein phosphatase PTEN